MLAVDTRVCVYVFLIPSLKEEEEETQKREYINIARDLRGGDRKGCCALSLMMMLHAYE